MVNANIQMVVSDLDGTLRRSDGTFGSEDLTALRRAGDAGVVRVCATGRTLYSCRQALSPEFPIDYLVFSSGAGIVDWRAQTMLRTIHLEPNQISRCRKSVALGRMSISWCMSRFPTTIAFCTARAGARIRISGEDARSTLSFCRPWNGVSALSKATQFLVIALPSDGVSAHLLLTGISPGLSRDSRDFAAGWEIGLARDLFPFRFQVARLPMARR